MKIKKFNLGFLKVERHIDENSVKPKSSFISIETKKSDKSSEPFIKIERSAKEPTAYKPIMESSINVDILPKNLYDLVKQEKVYEKKKEKPKIVAKMIGEIRALFANIIVFDAGLTALIIFLITYMLMMFVAISKIYSIIPSLIYLSVYLFFKLRENKFVKVENKFPNLNEKLRTVVDNLYVENDIVTQLRTEVFSELKQTDYGSFFKEKRTSYKILLIILLCFGIIFLAQYNFEFKISFDRVLGFMDGGDGNTTGIISDIISATIKGPDTDIYGDENLAKLGNDKLTIQINKVGYEVNLNDVKDPTQQEFEQSLFPEDVGLEKAEVYNKNILKENQDLVKNYFKTMAQSNDK
jgi:hypothetical protein